MMLVLFDNTTSSDEAMEAVTNMRAIVDKQCFISGMSGVVTDITVFFHRAGDYRNILCGADPVPALYRNLDPV